MFTLTTDRLKRIRGVTRAAVVADGAGALVELRAEIVDALLDRLLELGQTVTTQRTAIDTIERQRDELQGSVGILREQVETLRQSRSRRASRARAARRRVELVEAERDQLRARIEALLDADAEQAAAGGRRIRELQRQAEIYRTDTERLYRHVTGFATDCEAAAELDALPEGDLGWRHNLTATAETLRAIAATVYQANLLEGVEPVEADGEGIREQLDELVGRLDELRAIVDDWNQPEPTEPTDLFMARVQDIAERMIPRRPNTGGKL